MAEISSDWRQIRNAEPKDSKTHQSGGNGRPRKGPAKIGKGVDQLDNGIASTSYGLAVQSCGIALLNIAKARKRRGTTAK